MKKQQAAIVRSTTLLQKHSLSILPAVAFICGLLSTSVSQAQVVGGFTNVFWGGTNLWTSGNAALGGAGNWNGTGTNWTTNASGATGNGTGPIGGGTFIMLRGPANTATNNNSGGFIVNFSGTPGTVSQSSIFDVNQVRFLVSGYTWSASSARSLNFTNGIYLDNDVNTIITATAGNSFTFTGPGVSGGAGSRLTLGAGATSGTTNYVSTILFNGGGTISVPITMNVGGASNGFAAKIVLGTQSGVLNLDGNITNNSAGPLELTNSTTTNLTVNGVISGSRGIILNNTNTGKIILNAANTYSGGTTIFNSFGEINYSNSLAFGSGPITSSGNGTNYIRAVTDFLDLANAIVIGTNNTLRVGATSTSWKSVYSGVISGPGSVLYSYSGFNALLGTNSSFGGGFILGSSGLTELSKIGMAGSNSSIGTNGVITAGLITTPSSKPTIRWVGTTNDTSDKVINIANATGGLELQTLGNGNLTLTGNINSSGLGGPKRIFIIPYTNSSMVVSGVTNSTTNTLSLNGVINDGTPGYVVNDLSIGTIKTTNGLGTGTTNVVTNGVTSITLASVAGITIGTPISGGNCIANGTTITGVDPATKVITLSQATTNTASISAGLAVMPVSGATAATSLTIQPKSSVAASYVNVVLGNVSNSFSGGVIFTNAQSGLISLLKISKFGSAGEVSPLGTAGNFTIGGASGSTCTLDYTGTGEVITNKTITLGGSIGTVGLSQSGSGLLKLQGNIIQPGTTTAARSLSLTGSSTNGTGEIASNLGDMNGFPLGIQKDGSGTWTLSGTNSFSGPVKIQGNGSTLRFASPEALPAVANLEGIGSSGTYTFEMVASSPNYRMNAMSAFIMTFKSTNGPSTLTFTNTTTGNIVGGTSARAMTALTNARVVFEGPWDLNTSVAGSSRALSFNGDGTFVFNGSLNGSTLGTNSLIKASNGIAYLNASNNYNGGTQVQGGTLVVNHANAIPSVGFVTVSNNAILRVTAVVTNTISNPIVNSGTVQIASGGSMLASQITGGAVELGGSSSKAQLSVTTDPAFSSLIMTGNGNISLSSGGVTVPNAAFSGTSNTLTLTDVPSGSCNLVIVTDFNGLTLADNNSIVAVVSGTSLALNAQTPTLIGNKNYKFESTLTTLQLVVTSLGASELSYNYTLGGNWNTVPGNLTWLNSDGSGSSFSNGDSVTFAGGNTSNVTVVGVVQPNPLTFTNSSTGDLTLSGGTIQTPVLNVKGQGTVNLESEMTQLGGVLGINLSSGRLNLNYDSSPIRASDVNVTGGTLSGPAILIADEYILTGGEVSVSLGGSGNLNLGGTVTISGLNTSFTGKITISGPSVSIAQPDSLGQGVISLSGGGVLTMQNGWSLGNSVSIGSGGGSVALAGSSSSSAILSGNITNSAGTNTLTKSGLGKLSLTGLVGNTNSHVGLGNAAGNLVLSGSEKSIGNVSNDAVLTLDGVQVNTRGGWISGSGSITVTNSVTLSNLGTNFNCSNVVNIAPGGVFNVANSIFTNSSFYTNGVNGSEGKLVALAGGTNRLSGISTVGTIEIQEGASLRIDSGTISNTTVTNHGRLIFANASRITNVIGGTNGNTAANGDMTGSGVIAFAGSKWVALGGHIDGALKLSLEDSNNTYTQLLNSNNFTGGIVFATNNSRLSISNRYALGSGLIDAARSPNAQIEVLVTDEVVSWTITNEVSTGTISNSVMNFCPGSNNTLALNGLISGSGWLKVGSSPGGYLQVDNLDNTYTGGTEIGNGGIVVSDSLALGSGSINFSTGSNSVLKITGSTTFYQPMTIGAVSALTNAAIFDVATGMTAGVVSPIGVNTSYTNYSNQVVSVRKIGSGNLVLTANNTYKGTTSVEGGKLSIQTPYLSSSNDVLLTNNSTLDLDFNGTNTIAKLFINGVQGYQGTWGSLDSSADNTTEFITGTGLLKVTSGDLIPVPVTFPTLALNQRYDGTRKSVTPVTSYPNASLIVTYNGSSTAPRDVGSYSVVASVVNAPYTTAPGTGVGTLTINKGVSSFGWPTISPFTYTAGVGQGPVVSTQQGSDGAVIHYYEGVGSTSYASQTNKPTNAGTYRVTAIVPANSNYDTNTEMRDFTIAKAPHTLIFTSFGTKRYGMAPFSLPIDKGGSTGALTCTSSDQNVATVSSDGSVTIIGAGTTTIAVEQAADANYEAATEVSQTLTVYKNTQSIIFGALPNKVVGDSSFNLIATASSGLDVTYVSSNPDVATVLGNTVTIVGAGTTEITASQTGNQNVSSAHSVSQTLIVDGAGQTITFGSLVSKQTGDAPFNLTATASSGLDVTYVSSNPDVATVSGNTVTIVGAGTTEITASQGGNNNYNAATAVTQTLTVDPATPTTPTGSTFTNAFGSLNPTNVGADGLAYLMKYALGGTNTNDKVSLPTVALNGSALTLTAVVRTNDTNVQIVGQWITGLGGTWSNVPTMYGMASTNTNNVPNGCQRRDFSVPKDANSRLFLRLQARQTP